LLKLKTTRLASKKEAAFAILKSAQQIALKSTAYIMQLKKQERFLKSKSRDMVCHSLKTINKLNNTKEKEKQIESKQAAAAVTLSNALVLFITKTDPFVGLEVLLLLPKV
jgi:hypothetical protein